MNSLPFRAALLVSASICAAASATTVTVKLKETGMGSSEVVTITSPGINGKVHAGQQMVTATDSSNNSVFANGNYLMYCSDLYQHSPQSPKKYTVVGIEQLPDSSPMGAAKAAAIADLYAFANGAQFGANAAYACAFQLAIWETVTDFGGSLSVGSGQFKATGYSASAGAYLTQLLAAVGTHHTAALIGLKSGSYQDYIVSSPGNIPSPGSLALVGASGLLSVRRRRG